MAYSLGGVEFGAYSQRDHGDSGRQAVTAHDRALDFDEDEPGEPALKSGAYIRSKGLVVPVPGGSVAGGAFGASDLRAPVSLPAGVWFPNEPVTEMTIVSDRFDMTLSLLMLQDQDSGADMDDEPEKDVLDKMTANHPNRQAGWRSP